MATQIRAKNINKNVCDKCNFTCSKISDWTRHILTAKHVGCHSATEITPTTLRCDCGKIYKNRTGMWRHKQTCIYIPNRVISNISATEITPTTLHCDCGKTYKNRTGMWRHKQTCIYIPPPIINNIPVITQSVDAHNVDHTIIFELLKQNQEFKDLILEQNKQIIDLSKENNANVMELAGKMGNYTTNIKTQNNLFNLNIFLNETCKDAVDINDFIKDLPVSFQQLENIGRKGYVAGITDVILTQLKSMDITKRPLHCTDLKRDTMYIKNTNEWVQDDNDNTMMTQIFRRIAKNNLKQINKWSQENPISQVSDSKENIFCMNVMLNSLGAYGDAQLKLDNKVLKSIAKEVHVDRNSFE